MSKKEKEKRKIAISNYSNRAKTATEDTQTAFGTHKTGFNTKATHAWEKRN